MNISVITVNRNNLSGLKKTIESVRAQRVKPYEFIVIDGASTDGSFALLQEYSSLITYSVSEPDKGIYNAMNKGVAAAKGEYCIFMNSGDCFCNDDAIRLLSETGATQDIICGNAVILEDVPRRKQPPKEITLNFLYNQSLCHQSVLIRTSLLRAEPYDESLKIVADRKFFLKALVFSNCSYKAVDIDVANYDITGYSAKNRFASEQEWEKVLRDTLPERILTDYGRSVSGVLYGTSPYERMFLEIGRRKYRKPVYRMVRSFLSFLSIFRKSAGFVNVFPKSEV